MRHRAGQVQPEQRGQHLRSAGFPGGLMVHHLDLIAFENSETIDDAGVLTDFFAEGLAGLVVDDAQALRGIITKMDLVDYLAGGLEAPGRG